MVQTKTAPWGTTQESVAAWCALPVDWTGRKREGFRTPPKLAEGDANAIFRAAGFFYLEPPDLPWAGCEDLLDLAIDLDSALLDLESARDDGDREAVTDARETRDDCLEEFYGALRKVLHPDRVAAEDAGRDAMCAGGLPGMED